MDGPTSTNGTQPHLNDVHPSSNGVVHPTTVAPGAPQTGVNLNGKVIASKHSSFVILLRNRTRTDTFHFQSPVRIVESV